MTLFSVTNGFHTAKLNGQFSLLNVFDLPKSLNTVDYFLLPEILLSWCLRHCSILVFFLQHEPLLLSLLCFSPLLKCLTAACSKTFPYTTYILSLHPPSWWSHQIVCLQVIICLLIASKCIFPPRTSLLYLRFMYSISWSKIFIIYLICAHLWRFSSCLWLVSSFF